jgi:hypothetical protein
MKRVIVVVFVISLGLLLKSCNTTEPPPDGQAITLKLEDISCTEAWLELTTTNLQLPTAVTIKQNNQNRTTINLTKADTLLYVDSLSPKQVYTFQVSSIQNPVSSNAVNVTTLDTTSHNFTWQSFEFGQHSSSVLYDVAIIDENNIWAVGEIYMNDSLGQPDPKIYNAIYWDGTSWELKRITVDFRGNLITPILEGVFAFSNVDIWFVGSLPIHGDGQNWIMYDLRTTLDPDLSLSRAWGTSSNEIYFVGRSGSIAYHSGTNWRKIYSNTELHRYDIDGKYSEEENKYEVLVTAANRFVSFEKQILQINNSVSVIRMVTDGIPYSIKGLWFESDRQYYVCGGGVFNKKNIEDATVWKEIEVSEYYTEAIDGNGINDIVLCGDFGEFLHFNGVSWKSYQELFSGILLLNISIKQDLIVSVGIDNPKAFITIGRR